MTWQFYVFHTSGLCALEYLAAYEPSVLGINSWRVIDAAIKDLDQGGINAGNRALLRREHEIALTEEYATLATLDIMTYVMFWSAENPVPRDADFDLGFNGSGTPTPGLDLEDLLDRWDWIMRSPGGFWTTWVAAPTSQKKVG